MAEDDQHRARVNRDDLRAMLFGGWTGNPRHERAVTVVARAAARALLAEELAPGFDVVADDTNLRHGRLHAWKEVAGQAGALLEVWDMTDVPVETCVQRDAARMARGERGVGERVIRSMDETFRGSADTVWPT